MTRRAVPVMLLIWAALPLRTSAQAPAAPPLTLAEAERTALEHQPQLLAAQALAAAAEAQSREARSPYYPTAYASFTAVDAAPNSRIAAGGLNNPIIFDRYSNGVTVGGLVTDFGRTGEAVKGADLHRQAQQSAVTATRADVLLRVDEAYLAAQRAQAVLHVADETVRERQNVVDQVTAYARNQLKSTLDVSFAEVDLGQAKLLQEEARNDVDASFAELSAALGYADERTFTLVDPPPASAAPPDLAPLMAEALKNRPDLVSLRFDALAADRLARAQGDLSRPTVSFVATAGVTPWRQNTLSDRYAAAGVNLNVPIFNGHLFGSLHSEATARAEAQRERVLDLESRISRDVRVAWLNVSSAVHRIALTDQLLARARQALDLAQSRYQLGLSAIVELSQAQLNVTQAELAQAGARFDYAAHLAVLNYRIGRQP
jgi:outer membrane protein